MAKLFVRSLCRNEPADLKRLVRCNDGREVRRAQIIRLSAQGRTIKEITKVVGMSITGVKLVIHKFNEKGITTLSDKPRSGRPPKANAAFIACLKDAVSKSPRDFGYVFGSWTLARLREHLARRCKVLLHPHYLSRLMEKHGIVFRRPRHIMGHLRDPQDYEEKKEFLAFLKKTRGMPHPGSTCCSSMSVKFISTRPSPKSGPFAANALKFPRQEPTRSAAFTAH